MIICRSQQLLEGEGLEERRDPEERGSMQSTVVAGVGSRVLYMQVWVMGDGVVEI